MDGSSGFSIADKVKSNSLKQDLHHIMNITILNLSIRNAYSRPTLEFIKRAYTNYGNSTNVEGNDEVQHLQGYSQKCP